MDNFVPPSGQERLELAKQMRKKQTPTLNGSELRRWRDFTVLSQEAFANRLRQLGYQATSRSVRRWETGESSVPAWLSVLRLRDPFLSEDFMAFDISPEADSHKLET
jgi:DNA-binding transcriptional regulator YiaG